jgi:transketolase
MSSAGKTLGMGEVTKVEGRPSVLAPFGHALAAAGKRDARVVGLSADLAKYTDILPFRDAFPDRFFNVGMAEQNLVAVAAGLAKTGFVPFATTYAVFATRRAFDFLAIAVAHSSAPVRLFAGLPGLTTGYGGTHQAIDDLALASAIPGLTVIDPCDATEIAQIVDWGLEQPGPIYCRLVRGMVPVVLDAATYRFRRGKAAVLREGRDVGIVATGFMTERALDAAAVLEAEGISAGVLHVPCLKPFDAAGVTGFAEGVRALVTAENHMVQGGLGTRVVEALYAARLQRPLERVGLPDAYIECGSLPHLQDKYGITTPRIVARAREVLA